jgi:hypothetical protein
MRRSACTTLPLDELTEGRATGYCIIMREGSPSDRAFLKWTCEGDTVDCTGTFEYTGGTGPGINRPAVPTLLKPVPQPTGLMATSRVSLRGTGKES